MNNKKLGNEFEKEMVGKLAERGWWAHFISPDNRGAQPFDIIAAKDEKVIVGDCKTCKSKTFSINRLEANQISAFEWWQMCGNKSCYIFIKHEGKIYVLRYIDLVNGTGKVKIDGLPSWEQSCM